MTTPGDAHVPIRSCIGCRSRRPQAELFRCVLDADGSIRIDRGAPGRGAWLCGVACLAPARRRRAFDRAWRTRVEPAAIDRLEADLRAHTNERTGGDRPRPCETDRRRKVDTERGEEHSGT